MRVGWLADEAGYIGGAELTQAEFREAAPKDVEVVSCPPGGVVKGLDAYVIHNCNSYKLPEIKRLRAPLIKYVHDLWPAGDPTLRAHLLRRARLIFTSPLHVAKFPHRIRTGAQLREIPPALDLGRFMSGLGSNGGERSGCVCVGRMSYGKGIENLVEYPEPVDVYSSVPVSSRGSLRYRGALAPEVMPSVLAGYERFVFLPTAIEPFGRAVVEAWAAGLELEVNRNVGALDVIRESPETLMTAAGDFWRVILE